MVGTTGRAIQKSRNFITPPVMLRSKLECTDWNNWPCTILSTIANRTLQLQLAWLPASPLLRTFTPSELHDHFLPPQKKFFQTPLGPISLQKSMVTKSWRKEKTPGTKSIALLAIAQVAGEGIGLPLHFSLELAAPVNFKEKSHSASRTRDSIYFRH